MFLNFREGTLYTKWVVCSGDYVFLRLSLSLFLFLFLFLYLSLSLSLSLSVVLAVLRLSLSVVLAVLRMVKVSKREPKGSQSEPRSLQKHHLRNRSEKVMKKASASHRFGKPFLIKNARIPIQASIKNTIATQHWILYQLGGSKVDDKTHKEWMPKLVLENIRKIIIIHFFLMDKIMQIYYTVIKNQGFARCVFEPENK